MADHPALAEALQTSQLPHLAAHTVHLWHRASEVGVAELRATKAIRAQARCPLLRLLAYTAR